LFEKNPLPQISADKRRAAKPQPKPRLPRKHSAKSSRTSTPPKTVISTDAEESREAEPEASGEIPTVRPFAIQLRGVLPRSL